MKSQEDLFDQMVMQKVLDPKVSKILIDVARDTCFEEIAVFEQAVAHLGNRDIGFWLDSDTQFWLDERRYIEHEKLREEIKKFPLSSSQHTRRGTRSAVDILNKKIEELRNGTDHPVYTSTIGVLKSLDVAQTLSQ